MVGTVGVIASIPAQTMGVGVFTDILIVELEISRMQLSLAYLVGTLLSGILLPAGGRWIDALGMRKMMVYSAIFMGLSLFLLAASDWIADLVAGSLPMIDPAWAAFAVVATGFFFIRFWGQGILTLAARNIVGKWFDRKRGFVVGVSGIAVSLTFSLSPTLLNWLVEWTGWRLSWVIMGLALCLGFSIFAWAFARDNPEECGLEMDGPGEVPVRLKTNPDLCIHHDFDRPEALRSFAFWMFSLSFSWHALFFTAYTFHVVDIGKGLGLLREEMFILFFYASFISVAVNLGAGWISAHIRLKYLLAVQNSTLLLMALALLLADPVVSKGIIIVALGVGGGLWSNLFGTVYPRFFGRTHLGAVSGFAMSLTVVCSALGPYFFSVTELFLGSYMPAFWISIVVALLMTILALFADNPQRKLHL